jgi:hypothetical protein
MDECLSKHFSPCELWKQFKGNPAEWIGAAACISCGVRTIKDISKGKPPGCDECPKPYHPDPPIPEDPWQKDFVECLAAAVAEWEATHPGTPPDFDWVMNRAKDCMIDKGHPPDHIPTG